MGETLTSDVLIIGGGIVGASLAAGMSGAKVRVLDGGDTDLRAARANFGLIWVQSKGHNMAAYARWTRRSADLWPDFAEQLCDGNAKGLQLRQGGGLSFCLGEAALLAKREAIARLHNQREAWSTDISVLDRSELERLLPGISLGAEVSGASFCQQDGDCDPLALLRALHEKMAREGNVLHRESTALSIARSGGIFRVQTADYTFEAPRLIIAAGHGSRELAASVGLTAPLKADRGQILVTERLAPFLHYAGDKIRQTGDGTVMIGGSHEDAGFDTGTTPQVGSDLARFATAIFPDLVSAKLVRTWAGLRVLTPDGAPLYQESTSHPGAAVVTCHSGVTLAAVHARVLAPALLEGELGTDFAAFGSQRFDRGHSVSQAT